MPTAFARQKTADAYSVPETFPQKFSVCLFFVVGTDHPREVEPYRVEIGHDGLEECLRERSVVGKTKVSTLGSEDRRTDRKWRSSDRKDRLRTESEDGSVRSVVRRPKARIVGFEASSARSKAPIVAQEDCLTDRKGWLPIRSDGDGSKASFVRLEALSVGLKAKTDEPEAIPDSPE